MTGKRTGSGDNESQVKHTKIIKIEPSLDECDIKIEPVEDFDALINGPFNVLGTNGDDRVTESAICLDKLETTFTDEEQLRNQLDTNNREIKKEEGLSIMTRKRSSSGEMESPQKDTKRLKIEPNSDECDIKIEPVEDYDPLLSEHFDVLQVKCDDHMSKSGNHLSCFIRNISDSKLPDGNCVSIGIAHQKSDKEVTADNLSNTSSVQIEDLLDSAQRDIEIKAACQPKGSFVCNICFYRSDMFSEIRKHSLSHSEKTPSFDVSQSFKSDGTPVSEPNTIYGADKDLFCTFCSYRTSRSGHLKAHILTHTREKPFSCELCSFRATGKGHLNYHILTHTGERPFACELCSFRATGKGTLNHHILTHTGEKPFSCELCSFKTAHQGSLSNHILTHTGEGPFSCEHCSFKTTCKSNLKGHLLSHTGERPFSCDLCSFKTNLKNSLKGHILIHTGEKPFSCELCSFKTTYKSSLQEHILRHTGEKPFSCEHCSFKAAHKRNLRRHVLTHTGEKPYSCKLCSFKTLHKKNLNPHILTHTGERPFSCDHCSFKTTKRYRLKDHIMIHTGEKLSCEHCSFKTTTKYRLKVHISSHT